MVGGVYCERKFSRWKGGGGRMSKFLIGVGGLHPIPPVRKFLEIKDENFNVGVH